MTKMQANASIQLPELANPSLAIPDVLLTAVRDQRAMLFLGAGASREGKDANGHSTPLADELRTILCQKFLGKDLSGYTLMAAAEMLYAQVGTTAVLEYLSQVLRQFEPSRAHEIIPTFRWKKIATTNYDLLLERAYTSKKRKQDLLTFVRDNEPIEERIQQNPNGVEFLKLHGCIDHIHDLMIPPILSPEEYDRYQENRSKLFSRLSHSAQEFPIIFCGYALNDPHLRSMLLYRLEQKQRPQFYLITPHATEMEIAFWAEKKVTIIKATMKEFMETLDKAIPENARVLKVDPAVVESPIRKHYKTNSSDSTTLQTFLQRDVLHVHSGMQYLNQDAKEFYRGIDTGWGFIFKDLDVKRAVTEDFLLSIVAKLDNPENKPKLFVFKGPAGNGKSIALKRAAFEVATLNQVVLWVNDSAGLCPDALTELYDLTGKQIFLFVDRLALHAAKIRKILDVAQRHEIPLTIVGAESDSEWHGYCAALESSHPTELRVNYLSRNEINSLLDHLKKHNSLGLLCEKTREQQFKTFHESADRQLLVALHEATQGGKFEDIIFEEYADILPPEARQLYLDVCTLNQFGVPVRAGTIKRISGISFLRFSEEIFKPLQHIVFDISDRYTGDPQYRARHARVASMTFRRACPTSEERATQLIRLAKEIDVGFSVDRQAFERIIKARILAQIVDLDSGRRIYKTLSEVVPKDAYLYQQWAIFESNDPHGSMADAQSYADQARKLDPAGKTIIHTLAEIARKRANQDIPAIMKEGFRADARARLSEIRNQNDRFVISTKAKLLIDELEDLSETDSEDISRVVDKTKQIEVLLETAQKTYTDPEFDEIEARFRKVLVQQDKFVLALKRAIDGGATKDGLPIRLSKAYREKGEIDLAYATLTQALERSPESKMLHLAYAKMLLEDGEAEQKKILDHLTRSYDQADVNFEARFVHAQLLFANGEKAAASKIFNEIDSKAPEGFQTRSSAKHSHVSKYICAQAGKIAFRNDGLLFLTSPGYPGNILVPQDQSNLQFWRDLEVGAEVKFDVQFNRKGPVAVDVMSTNTTN